jgi:hypothetical protein
VDDLIAIKCSHQVVDPIDCRYVGKKGIAKSCSLGCSFDQTGNVNDLQHSWLDAWTLPCLYQVLELLIGNNGLHNVRIDRAERLQSEGDNKRE